MEKNRKTKNRRRNNERRNKKGQSYILCTVVTKMDTNKLKRLMKEKNISIYRLSKLTGLRDAGLGRIVNGKSRYILLDTAARIALALDVSVDELLEEDYRKDVNTKRRGET